MFMVRVCGAVLSVHYSLVVTCWERANLLAIFSLRFYHFHMWCSVSFFQEIVMIYAKQCQTV